VSLPTDAAELRQLLGARSAHRGPQLRQSEIMRLLLRTDAQLLELSTVVQAGVEEGLSCYRIAGKLPKWADEALVRTFVRAAIRVEARPGRLTGWASYHARKLATGEAYTCRRGRSIV
jgi:hypothetical protein